MRDSSADQHRSVRMPQYRRARCFFNNGSSSLDVTLRNMSTSGARVVGENLLCLPQTFELHIYEGGGAHSVRSARMVWTDGTTAGLKFVA